MIAGSREGQGHALAGARCCHPLPPAPTHPPPRAPPPRRAGRRHLPLLGGAHLALHHGLRYPPGALILLQHNFSRLTGGLLGPCVAPHHALRRPPGALLTADIDGWVALVCRVDAVPPGPRRAPACAATRPRSFGTPLNGTPQRRTHRRTARGRAAPSRRAPPARSTRGCGRSPSGSRPARTAPTSGPWTSPPRTR